MKVKFLPYISGKGKIWFSSYIATTPTIALGRAIFQAVSKVFFPPAASITESAPLFSVSFLISFSISQCCGLNTKSASPNFRARLRRNSSISIAIILPGLKVLAHAIEQSPTGPAPITAM